VVARVPEQIHTNHPATADALLNRHNSKQNRTTMDKTNNKPARPIRQPTRLKDYDYTSKGAYFVTICTDKRTPHFANPTFHALLYKVWQELPDRYPGTSIDEFVIMPDHIHGIIWLDGTKKNAPTLSQVIGAYKSIITVAWLNHHKNLGVLCSKHLWQSDYYDHIIRNDQDLERTRQYIIDNPIKHQESHQFSPNP
jgi:putative transposase